MPRRRTPGRGGEGDRQPRLALVRPGSPVTDADRGREARKVRLDPFYLDFRAQRQRYIVCWYDPRARAKRSLITGVGPGPTAQVPGEAREALAAHYTAYARPAVAQAPAEAGLSAILTRYLADNFERWRDPAKDAVAVEQWEGFVGERLRRGLLVGLVTVGDITEQLVDDFIAWRRDAGDVGETINRKLATIRGAVNHARKKRWISEAPYIQQVPESQCSGPRELEWSIEQVAAILEAARARPDRWHVFDFIIASLSSHGRTNAILDCDLDAQRRGRLIDWLRPGEDLTLKRRSIVPVAPSWDAWIHDRKGKLIQYRVPIAEANRAKHGGAAWFVRPTRDIGNALAATTIAAGLAHPSLGLVRPLIGADGTQMVRTFRYRRGDDGRIPDPEPLWEALGTPNTFRHTCHTYCETVGVPPAQVDLAAGHAPRKGSGRNYTHLRPEYLREFIAAIEGYWAEMDAITRVHRRNHVETKVAYLAPARAAAIKP